MKAHVTAALLLATPLAAQDRMTPEQCTQTLTTLAEMIGMPMLYPASVVGNEGWCLLTDFEIQIDERTTMRFSTLRWRASDVARFIDDGLPPRAVEVEGKGVGIVPQTNDAILDYLLGLQMNQSQMGFGASVRWDGVKNAVNVETAYIEFNADNRIEASALIEGVDLSDMAAIQTSIDNVGLRDLNVKSQFGGWFETNVLLPVGMHLLNSNDGAPQVQVENYKRQAVEFVNELPNDFMPSASKDALANFITALPTPRGTAQLQLSADPTIGAARALIFSALPDTPTATQVIETSLDGVTMLFTWTPMGDPN